MDSNEEFESEFDESKWTDDETDLECDIFPNIPHNSLSESSVLSTSSRNQINPQPHWCCAQCNQLNNLKDTLECTQCDGMYEIGSPIISLIPTEETLDWKCKLCTFVNSFSNEKCEMCSCSKPDDQHKTVHSSVAYNIQDPYNKRYRDKYSTALVCGYLRALCKYWLDFNRTKYLCPYNAVIPDTLSNTVLNYFQFSNFWDVNICLLQYWTFDKQVDEKGNIIQDKSTLMLKDIDNDDSDSNKNKTATYIHAFSSQKAERLGDYSWTLQIQHIDEYRAKTQESVKCFIGVTEYCSDEVHSVSHNSSNVFCKTEQGFGVYGFDGYKKFNEESKYFCKPFRVNDIINVKLECTIAYYELRYMINNHDIGVAWRIPNDKVYEMVIAFSSKESENKNNLYKIKCISFETKPYVMY